MLTQLFTSAFALPQPSSPAPCISHCAMCGLEIDWGHPFRDVVSSASSEIQDVFRYQSDYVCGDCAAAFAASRTLTGGLYADSAGVGLRPMVARASATEERPAWTDLVRGLPRDVNSVSIITLNTKRRLWPSAVVSRFGPAWMPLYHNGDVSRPLRIDADRLLEVLAVAEYWYNNGISKRSMVDSVLRSWTPKSDMALLMEAERAIAPWRGTDELELALFIGQKTEAV